jgi:hypothetical protein
LVCAGLSDAVKTAEESVTPYNFRTQLIWSGIMDSLKEATIETITRWLLN